MQGVKLKFGLGLCGRDEFAKALTLKAKGAAESFWLLFAEKSNCHCPAEGRRGCVNGLNWVLKMKRI